MQTSSLRRQNYVGFATPKKKKSCVFKLSSISLFSFCCCCGKAKRENKQINKCFACVYAAMGGGLSKWNKKKKCGQLYVVIQDVQLLKIRNSIDNNKSLLPLADV